jgi:hypothetical protein
MPRKSIIAIVAIILCSFLIVVILHAISDDPLKYAQGFVREFGHAQVVQKNVLGLKDKGYYIAGVTNTQVFLGNERDSLELLITDTALSTPQHIRLSVSNDKTLSFLKVSQPMPLGNDREESIKLRGSFIEIDSPFFYIKAGDLPGIFKGTIGDWKATRIAENIPFFFNAVSLGKNAFAFMAMGSSDGGATQQNIISKISDGNKVKLNTRVLEGQVDTYFSTRGILRHSKKLNQLVYTYFYRNQYLVIDTSLTLQYKGNTVDTVSSAHIKPVEVRKSTFTLASTPAAVNNGSQIFENLLYVHSNIMASNETRKVFDVVSVIDVYDIKVNAYQFSFYLPNYNSIKMTNFKVAKNKIIALYGQYLVSYSIDTQSFEKSEL